MIEKIIQHIRYRYNQIWYLIKTYTKFKWYMRTKELHNIVIGASKTNYPGWTSTEYSFFDVTDINSWINNFGDKKLDHLLAEHVFEHLTEKQIVKALGCAAKFMKSQAVFRIAIPDGYHPSRYYRDLVKPGGLEPAAADHKVLLTIDTMFMLVPKNKFIIRPVECFDRKGIFHSNYSEENGFVSRSRLHYDGLFTHSESEYKKLLATTPRHLRNQFKIYGISSTSLIVDLIRK